MAYKRNKMPGKRRKKLVSQLIERDGLLCAYCGTQLTDIFQFDYAVRARYGRDASVTYAKGDELITIPYTVSKPPHIDHIIPVSRGGKNNLENLVLSCQSCNSKKGAK
jgi:5-methylcytosine-specific restriction endonuclease McrA